MADCYPRGCGLKHLCRRVFGNHKRVLSKNKLHCLLYERTSFDTSWFYILNEKPDKLKRTVSLFANLVSDLKIVLLFAIVCLSYTNTDIVAT